MLKLLRRLQIRILMITADTEAALGLVGTDDVVVDTAFIVVHTIDDIAAVVDIEVANLRHSC